MRSRLCALCDGAGSRVLNPAWSLSPQERQDPEGPGDVLDLDVDELSQYECMAPLVALVQHMQRLEAALPGEEVSLRFLVSLTKADRD